MQAVISVFSCGTSAGACLVSLDALQGYLIATNTVVGVLLENGRALWTAVWLLGGGMAG